MVSELGAMLIDLAATARREFVMCAPFAKRGVIDRVLEAVPADVEVVLFTRWRPEEVAAGVSDTGVLASLRARGGIVLLHDRLHAKFYRNESRTLVGSANLTATALGWSAAPNLELLVESESENAADIEHYLRAEGVEATEALASQVDEIANLLPKAIAVEGTLDIASTAPQGDWIPQLRIPSDLFLAYSQGLQCLTERSAMAAAADLEVLDVPPGLDRQQFERLVGHRLGGYSLFQQLDEFLATPRRFGEVRQMLGEMMDFDRDRADEAWQTMMRWMLEFLPHRYSRVVARHTEVMKRIANEMGS